MIVTVHQLESPVSGKVQNILASIELGIEEVFIGLANSANVVPTLPSLLQSILQVWFHGTPNNPPAQPPAPTSPVQAA